MPLTQIDFVKKMFFLLPNDLARTLQKIEAFRLTLKAKIVTKNKTFCEKNQNGKG